MSDSDTSKIRLGVIGAGPGGYVAAFHAADRGMDVTLIEADPQPGGTCLQRGCIPSKALLQVAKLIHESRAARAWGLEFAEPRIDLDKLRQWKSSVIEKLSQGIVQLCKARRVDRLRGRARFVDSQTLQVDRADGSAAETLRFDHLVIATGSVPAVPNALNTTDLRVMDSTGALELADIPPNLLVIGGGYIGLELGTVYAALGSRVTLVELADSLLPRVDADLVRPLQRRLKQAFASIHVNATVERLTPTSQGITAQLHGSGLPPQETFDRVVLAVGRQPNSEDLGLENTRVNVNADGFVEVDHCGRTADPHIWAIGDVAGQPMLAHKASREAKVAVEAITGRAVQFDNRAVPGVVFTDPEIAYCGLTETQAKDQGRPIKVTKFHWLASGRALTLSRPEGLTKLIWDPATEQLLGMGIVGVGAGELIAQGVLAVEMGATARDMAASIHPHPTLSETVLESAEAVLGQATHLYDPRRS